MSIRFSGVAAITAAATLLANTASMSAGAPYRITPIATTPVPAGTPYQFLQYEFAIDSAGTVYYAQQWNGPPVDAFADLYRGDGTAPPSVVYSLPHPAAAGQANPYVEGPVSNPGTFLSVDRAGDVSFFGNVYLAQGGVSTIGNFILPSGTTTPVPFSVHGSDTMSGVTGVSSRINDSQQVAVLAYDAVNGYLNCVHPAIVGPTNAPPTSLDPLVYCPVGIAGWVPPAINNHGDVVYGVTTGTLNALNFYTTRTTPSGANASIINDPVIEATLASFRFIGRTGSGAIANIGTEPAPSVNDHGNAAVMLVPLDLTTTPWELALFRFDPANQSRTPQILVTGGVNSGTTMYGGALCGNPSINENNEVLFLAGAPGSTAPSYDCSTTLFVVDPSATAGFGPRRVVSAGDTFTDLGGLVWTVSSIAATSQQSSNAAGSIAVAVLATTPSVPTVQPFILRADPLPGASPGHPILPTNPTAGATTWNLTVPMALAPACTPACPTAWHAYLDPPIAAGYTYTVGSGAPNFADVYVPTPLAQGQTDFVVTFADAAGNSYTQTLHAGTPLLFTQTVPAGVASFTISGINAAEALDATNPAAFVVGVSFTTQLAADVPVRIDSQSDSGPVVTPKVVGTLGSNGWYTGNVAVTWSVTDGYGAILSQVGCDPTNVTTDTAGLALTCTASSAGGTTTQAVTIRRDATPPSITATPLPVPNGAGWNNSAVSVSFTGLDSTSGIASCSAPVVLAGQGAGQSASGTCTDNAGNVSAPITYGPVNIELAGPVVSDVISATPNAAGWYNVPVTVTFTGTDPLSGVAAGGCTPSTVLATNGSGQTITGTCTNLAGNTSTVTVTGLNIDTIPPVATASIVPPPNANGWNNSPVTVSFAGTDSLSGSGVASCVPSTSLATDGAGQVVSGACTDVAGNGSAPVSVTVNLDQVPPIVTLITPATGAGFPVGYSIAANYQCSDGLSGVASGQCAGTVVQGAPIDTSTPGNATFQVTATDQAGNIATGHATYLVSTLNFSTPGSIWTLAGNGQSAASGDGGPAVSAGFSTPTGVAVDAAGHVYLVDSLHSTVRVVDQTTGLIQRFAGNGTAGYTGDGGPASSAELYGARGVAVDAHGNVFIADTNNHVVRRVDGLTSTISTVAGNGTCGFTGDGGPALAAQLCSPWAVSVDGSGNLYISDSQNLRIRRVDASTQAITTYAGNGGTVQSGDGGPATSASLSYPYAVAVDASGNLFIADGYASIRRVDAATRTISTVAGTGVPGESGDGGPATAAAINTPYGVAVDGGGNLYITEVNGERVRRVDATSRVISTYAGTIIGYAGDGGPATAAQLNQPESVAVDGNGTVYVADTVNNRVRFIPAAGAPPVITPTINGTLGQNGWYTSDVAVAWTVTSAQATSSQTGCDTTTVTTDTAGLTLTCTATNAAGTTSQSITVKRDASGPTTSWTASPLPNGNGWNKSDVTVSFTATSLSGVTCTPASVVVSSQGQNQAAYSACLNGAGRNLQVIGYPINIDKTPPVASATTSSAPGASGWYRTPVTVQFTAVDALSGVSVAPCAPATTVLSASGAAQGASSTCSDLAGNTAAAAVSGLNIDTVAPVAVATRSPAANAAGWNNTAVTVTFAGTDSVGGSGVASCTPPATLAAAGASQSASGTCTDVAGNVSAPASVTGINLDFTAPTASITTPANGASFSQGASVSAAYACQDTLSGVATCAGTVASGAAIDTSTTGAHAFSVTATDRAGNATTVASSYTVNTAGALPVVIPVAAGTLGTNGWYTSSVSLTWQVTSASTITARSGCQARSVTNDTTGVTYTCSATNAFGTTTVPITIKKDSTPPVLRATVSPRANSLGWHNTPVTVTFTCTDSVSGVASCTGPVVDGLNGAGLQVIGLGTNNAGLGGKLTQGGINIDQTSPVATIRDPYDGTSYGRNNVVFASYSCSNAISPIVSCTGSVPNGSTINTSRPGYYHFTVTARNAAGTTTTTTSSYQIL